MKLSNFDNKVPDNILDRGHDYFNNGCVASLEEVSEGNWEALVQGSDDYQVIIELEDSKIQSWSCDCPYDKGDICKHVVATLLAIRHQRKFENKGDEHENLTAVDINKDKNGLTELLKHVKTSKLLSFLSDCAENDQKFKQKILETFSPKIENHDFAYYKKNVEKCFNISYHSYNRYGYANDESDIAACLDKWIQKARYFAQNENTGQAVYILLSIAECTGNNYEDYQDYDGELASSCQDSVELLRETILKGNCPENVIIEVKEKTAKLMKSKNFNNYDLADISALYLDLTILTQSLAEGIETLNKLIEKSHDEYDRARLVRTKIELLKKSGMQEQLDATIEENLSIPEVRRMKIDKLILGKEYDAAISYIEDGISLARSKNHSGTVADWNDLKLEINILQKDIPGILKEAENLYFHGRERTKYYKILKEYTNQDDWINTVEHLLKSLGSDQINWGSSPKADIYIAEKMWDRLMDLVAKGNLNDFETYEKYLKPHYPERMLNLFATRLDEYAERNMGRDHYQYVAKVLKRMQTYPDGKKKVSNIVSNYREKYKKRPAMMQELKGIE